MCASVVALAQLPALADREPIAYTHTAATDAVARLQAAIDRGETRLEFDAKRGYLPSVLKALDVPVSSQGLVFSRTSLQVDRIAPWSPRAIYFNDDIYVGWVQGGPIMEIASVDPKLGAVFYTLDQRPGEHPTFERQTRMCLICHDSSSTTGGVPGFIMRSVFTDRYGYAFASVGSDVTTDRTPIEERWGGWYVTGVLRDQTHMGNVMAPMLAQDIDNKAAYVEKLKRQASAGVADLHGRFDVNRYLTTSSDIVGVLVLAHQTEVHNLITAAAYNARIEGEQSPRAKDAVERLVRALLFVDAAPLNGPIAGTSGFAAEFSARGPRDRQGRSLRELDLKTRVFRYPLSYLIYSEGFDALPAGVRTQVYRRLRQILSGEDAKMPLQNVAADARQSALEILQDTKPDFTHPPAGTRSGTDK